MSDSFATPWTVAWQAPLSMGFPRQYWSGLPFPSPGDLHNPALEPTSPALTGGVFITEPPGKPRLYSYLFLKSQREEVQLKWLPVVVVQLRSHVQLFETPWTTARQASLALTIS